MKYGQSQRVDLRCNVGRILSTCAVAFSAFAAWLQKAYKVKFSSGYDVTQWKLYVFRDMHAKNAPHRYSSLQVRTDESNCMR